MTDHKFTDDEIVELLRAYVEIMCGKCNVKDLGTCCDTCFITAISQAADIVKSRKAEIELLREIVFMDRSEAIKNLKSETIKEFAKRLKAKEAIHFCKCGEPFVYTDLFNGEIDTLVKEMTEKEV